MLVGTQKIIIVIIYFSSYTTRIDCDQFLVLGIVINKTFLLSETWKIFWGGSVNDNDCLCSAVCRLSDGRYQFQQHFTTTSFAQKCLCSHSLITLWFCIFLWKKHYTKETWKMLVKLTKFHQHFTKNFSVLKCYNRISFL